MTMLQDVVGVDIAKDWIDVYHLSRGGRGRIVASGPALARFVNPGDKLVSGIGRIV